MKTFSTTDAQSDFPKILQWLKSAPVTIQEKNENIAVILDYHDYIDLVEIDQEDWLHADDRLIDLEGLF